MTGHRVANLQIESFDYNIMDIANVARAVYGVYVVRYSYYAQYD